MTKRTPILSRFPNAPFIVRAKFWTPQRSTIELEGPYGEIQGALALQVLSTMDPTAEQREAMAALLAMLQEHEPGDDG